MWPAPYYQSAHLDNRGSGFTSVLALVRGKIGTLVHSVAFRSPCLAPSRFRQGGNDRGARCPTIRGLRKPSCRLLFDHMVDLRWVGAGFQNTIMSLPSHKKRRGIVPIRPRLAVTLTNKQGPEINGFQGLGLVASKWIY